MEDNKGLMNELEGLSPFLHKLKQKKPEIGFKVPENYFANLSNDILIRAKAEAGSFGEHKKVVQLPIVTKKESNLLRFIRKPSFKIGLAASFALLVAVWLAFPTEKPQTELTENVTAEIKDVSSDDVYQYVSENIKDFDEETLFDTSVSSTETVNDIDFQSLEFSEEELNNYFKNEEISEDDLN